LVFTLVVSHESLLRATIDIGPLTASSLCTLRTALNVFTTSPAFAFSSSDSTSPTSNTSPLKLTITRCADSKRGSEALIAFSASYSSI
jgi:hypothetical protein